MKRGTLIAALAAVMIMICSAFAWAGEGLSLVESYPADGETNASMENLGVKLTFSDPINSDEAKAADADKFVLRDAEGEKVPTQIWFSEEDDGLVLVLLDPDSGYMAKNNTEYTLTISGELVDNDGDMLGADQTITFKTYNQKANNMVNMAMMMVMFGGIMFFSLRQNDKKEEEKEIEEKDKEAFNPYREAKRTGKSVEEVKAEHAKQEEKLAKKKARKKKADPEPQEGKIENCAELLNNVYHVHAPAPINKADRSVDALISFRREKAREAKAAERAAKAEREAKARKKK